MKSLLLASLFIIFTNRVVAQVIPFGTIIIGKRLPTLFSGNTLNENNSSATLFGSIKINDSKLSIDENGFVILLNSDVQSPNILNARKVIVSGGTADFQTTLDDFASNTSYKYRAYAKNSKGEYAYSQIIIFTTFKNFCEYQNCKNGASCISDAVLGAICVCTNDFCGDCCAQGASANCPGGGEQLCSLSWVVPIAYADNFDKNKFQNNVIRPSAFKNSWVNTGYVVINQSINQSIVNALK